MWCLYLNSPDVLCVLPLATPSRSTSRGQSRCFSCPFPESESANRIHGDTITRVVGGPLGHSGMKRPFLGVERIPACGFYVVIFLFCGFVLFNFCDFLLFVEMGGVHLFIINKFDS